MFHPQELGSIELGQGPKVVNVTTPVPIKDQVS